MSLGIYPVFQPELIGDKFDALGEILASNYEEIDKIARRAKLTPLSAFADNREIPDDFDGDPDDLAEAMGEWTEWFDPADGLAAMHAIVDHINSNPRAVKRLDDSAEVIAELEELARALSAGAAQGAKFRLEMS